MYYILNNIATDENNNLKKPYRILHIPNNFPFKPNSSGYKTLKDLRKKNYIWIKYNKSDPKSANKICEERFVLKVKDFVLTPSDYEFDKVSFKILKHTIMGELSNNINGIHLLSNLNPNIKEVTQNTKEDINGVWKADIKYYSKVRKKEDYYKKSTTMFPKIWTPNLFMCKIYEAYINKKQCNSSPYKYHSITNCGIPVDFIIKDNKIKTVYPIYQEV